MSDEKAPRNLPRLTWAEALARRLERHWLARPAHDATPAEIVGAICGAHAQIITAAELSIGLRLDGAPREAVRAALWSEQTLIKTYGPRGTVHLLPARDLPLWSAALSAIPTGSSTFPDGVRMTPEQTAEIVDAIAELLAEADLTIEELTEALAGAVGPWAVEPVMPAFQELWPRWRMATTAAANSGALCFGPNRGRKVTYASPRRWLPGFQPADERGALAEIVRRYLHAYGPATPRHFARWLGAPPGWATELFASMSSELEQIAVEDNTFWVVAGDTVAPVAPPQGVRLLPYFDAYVVGSYPRERVYPGLAAERALARGQAGNFPVLLVDGVVAGVWHMRRAGKRLDITIEPLNDLNFTQRQDVEDQAARTGAFLEGNPRLTYGPVTVGPHA